MGPDARAIHDAFMNSPAHRSNILDTDFTEVGIGTATDENGTLYVTEVFRQPLRRRVSAPVASAPAPASVSAAPVVRRVRHDVVPVIPAVPQHRAPAIDPVVALRHRLAAAEARAAKSRHAGALSSAMTFHDVVASL
jgi:uncharacterized protein YkwD